MRYFTVVLLGNKVKVPSLKYYSAYRGKSVTTQSFISFLPETVPDGAVYSQVNHCVRDLAGSQTHFIVNCEDKQC